MTDPNNISQLRPEISPLELKSYQEELGQGVELTMVKIPAGSFRMGSPESEPERFDDEGPQHEVTLGAFWMAQTPITQAQWREVAGWPRVERDLEPDPSSFKGANRPVERVNWHDAQEFCRRLSQRTGKNYILPSEAQWEYACRAGTTTPFHCGATLTPDQANCSGSETCDVASFPANGWGLHDMHGNVWEWCQDRWHGSYDGAPSNGSAWEDDSLGKSQGCCVAGRGSTTPRTAARPTAAATPRTAATTTSVSAFAALDEDDSLGEPQGCCEAGRGSTTPGTAARPTAAATTRTTATTSVSASVVSDDETRLLRGGSWFSNPTFCRSASRGNGHPVIRFFLIGFRVCCLPQD